VTDVQRHSDGGSDLSDQGDARPNWHDQREGPSTEEKYYMNDGPSSDPLWAHRDEGSEDVRDRKIATVIEAPLTGNGCCHDQPTFDHVLYSTDRWGFSLTKSQLNGGTARCQADFGSPRFTSRLATRQRRSSEQDREAEEFLSPFGFTGWRHHELELPLDADVLLNHHVAQVSITDTPMERQGSPEGDRQ
jgi:hypothetical protein